MRLKLLVLALLCVASAAVASPAHAVTYGISENQDRMFSHPLFAPLEVQHVRLVVSYDVMTNTQVDGGEELARVTNYFANTKARGIEVLVSFNHSRGNWRDCLKKKHRRKKICRLPSVNEYRTNVQAFLDAFQPEAVSPWNEINHRSQPTYNNPKRAAEYTKAVKKIYGGTVVEGDFLDFKFKRSYAKKFRKALGKRPNICGLHNYVDVNRFRSNGTKGMMKALKCKQYWWTETGGQYKSAGFKASQTRQAKATKQMFKLAKKLKPQRVYNYSYFGSPDGDFDAGLINSDTDRKRKAYDAFAKGF